MWRTCLSTSLQVRNHSACKWDKKKGLEANDRWNIHWYHLLQPRKSLPFSREEEDAGLVSHTCFILLGRVLHLHNSWEGSKARERTEIFNLFLTLCLGIASSEAGRRKGIKDKVKKNLLLLTQQNKDMRMGKGDREEKQGRQKRSSRKFLIFSFFHFEI